MLNREHHHYHAFEVWFVLLAQLACGRDEKWKEEAGGRKKAEAQRGECGEQGRETHEAHREGRRQWGLNQP